jgi:predicted secreted protein
MKVGSIIAIYFLMWVGSAFILLPFGVRTDEEVGAPLVPGQADSAPHRFDFKRHAIRATILSFALFALYYANWTYGWIGVDALDFYNPR